MKLNLLRPFLLAVLVGAVSTAAVAGDLKMSMQNGRVTIIADNVPLRQILAEWARIGQSKILNIEKVNGPAVTLQLVDTPEKDALDILLRSASGYIAAPRAVAVVGASMYDRITIMPTSRPPSAVATATVTPPTFQRPPQAIDEGDEPINVVPNQPQNPVVGPYPGMPPGAMPPNGVQPGAVQTPVLQSQPGMPTTPQTSPRPGALPPPTPANGVPNPYQVVRPGPGGPGGPGGGPGGF